MRITKELKMTIQERFESYFKTYYKQLGKTLFFRDMSKEEMSAMSYKKFCERFMKHAGETTWFWREDDGVSRNSEVLKYAFSWNARGYELAYKVGYIRPLIKEYVKSLND